MLEWLRSGERQFAALFVEVAVRATRAARALEQLFREPLQRERLAAAIQTLEHEADRSVREVHVRLSTTFLAAIDSGDVHAVATHLDDVMDWIDATARRAIAFRVTEVRAPAVRLVVVLVRATEHLELAVVHIKDSRVVLEHVRAIGQLEAEGDVLYGEAVSALFEGRPDPLEVLEWKELYDHLEEAIDACKHASAVLESISLKHA
jgi:uncharacterized protein